MQLLPYSFGLLLINECALILLNNLNYFSDDLTEGAHSSYFRLWSENSVERTQKIACFIFYALPCSWDHFYLEFCLKTKSIAKLHFLSEHKFLFFCAFWAKTAVGSFQFQSIFKLVDQQSYIQYFHMYL